MGKRSTHIVSLGRGPDPTLLTEDGGFRHFLSREELVVDVGWVWGRQWSGIEWSNDIDRREGARGREGESGFGSGVMKRGFRQLLCRRRKQVGGLGLERSRWSRSDVRYGVGTSSCSPCQDIFARYTSCKEDVLVSSLSSDERKASLAPTPSSRLPFRP